MYLTHTWAEEVYNLNVLLVSKVGGGKEVGLAGGHVVSEGQVALDVSRGPVPEELVQQALVAAWGRG